ncbi:uncharacterized protein LOC116169222 [Photinus pyralis]|uniref:uncharacterized protein LOC116169222 n=1 Tax=Photinus pyralis TaxID=7054 RepID=UPI001267227C|nr:uncharacterized protein LOC116169222 [Photinus pyralis]
MDKLKKARAPVRTQLTRLINTIGDLLNQESVDELRLQVKLESLHENARKIDDYDNHILELMAEDDNIGEDSQETEFLAQEEYRESYRMAKIRTENYFEGKRVATNDKASNVVVSEGLSSTVNLRTPHNTKYPKITIKRFEGDLRELLGFWAQFKNIHEDPQLPVSEKFQYLVQSITKGSKAYGVVSSYPQADDNYSKVIEALKKRFGKEEILVEVYRSYVKEDVAQSVGAMFVETEYLAQAVFGGSITPARTINKYKFMLQSLNSTTTQEIEALGQKTICEYIPKLNSGPWLRELSDKNIWINDMTSENTDVEIIIGCDYYGSIVFGKAVRLECGLTAMETIFGWTVLGEIKNNFVSEGLAMAVSCLALSNVDVSDLWRLELLGITDPIEVQSREERERIICYEQFLKTIQRDAEGRYVREAWSGRFTHSTPP